MLLKQICQSVELPIKRNFEEARLLVAFFITNLKILCSFLLIGMTEYFLTVHLVVRVECYATTCLQDSLSDIYAVAKFHNVYLLKNLFIAEANVACTGLNSYAPATLKTIYRCCFAKQKRQVTLGVQLKMTRHGTRYQISGL